MQTVTSADGNRIAFRRTGSGPPLVLVHGAAGDHSRWEVGGVRAALAEYFTVLAMDRRGRGGSGDAPGYEIEREFQDVAAVAGAAGEPAILLGHSYGALCALEAALLVPELRGLILYEPPIPTSGHSFDTTDAVARVRALLAAGDREGALAHFLLEIAELTSEEVETLRRLPSWPGRVAAAHTLPREEEAAMRYRFDPTRFRALVTPTLLLVGGASHPGYRRATDAVAAALPDRRTVVLEGQGHVAMNTAPDRFVAEVVAFARGLGRVDGTHPGRGTRAYPPR